MDRGGEERDQPAGAPIRSLARLSPVTAVLLAHQMAEVHQLAQLPPFQGPSQQDPGQTGGVLLRYVRLGSGRGHGGRGQRDGDHAVAAQDVSFWRRPAQRQRLAVLHRGAGGGDHPPALRGVLGRHGVYVLSGGLPERGFRRPLHSLLLFAQADVLLARRIAPPALAAVSPASALLKKSGGQINRGGHAAGRPQTHGPSTQVCLAGVPPSGVGVGQPQASALLLGGVLGRRQEARVKLAGLHPAIGHDKQGFPALGAGALPASLPRHAKHGAADAAAVAQQASLSPLDGGLAGTAPVGGLVGHDPAYGETRERRPDGKGRDRRCHKQVEGDQALRFNQQTLLKDSCTVKELIRSIYRTLK